MFGEGGTYISVNYSFLRGLYGCKCAFIVLSLIVWGNQCNMFFFSFCHPTFKKTHFWLNSCDIIYGKIFAVIICDGEFNKFLS